MGLCEQCQSISSTVLLLSGLNKVFHHSCETLKKSVFEAKCYVCSRVWDSLTEEQKAVASHPDFEGIDCKVSLQTSHEEDDGWQERVLAKITFTPGDDLYDCEDYETVGGKIMEHAGQFAILNPFRGLNCYDTSGRSNRTVYPS